MDAMVPSTDAAGDGVVLRTEESPPVEILSPPRQTLPIVVASPHSGDRYPADFVRTSRLDPAMLRRSEDCHVHGLVAAAPRLGAPLLRATFPRAYLDPNREAYELDPRMFDGPLPRHANTRSPRVAAGLGTIARVVASGAEIYAAPLPVAEIEHRLSTCYRPYHAALQRLVRETRDRFGVCILMDCHSMPSGAVPGTAEVGAAGIDFVLGDCHGISCNRIVPDTVRAVLERRGFTVTRNTPYAGGYTTRHYGRPLDGIHALQIEINRRLYMNEATYAPTDGFASVAAALTEAIEALGALPRERRLVG